MPECSRRGLLIAGLVLLFLLIAIGIGIVIGFFVIPVEEACDHIDEENAKSVVRKVIDKLHEESRLTSHANNSDQGRSAIYHEALDVLELVTCAPAKNWTWASSKHLPGHVGKISDRSEVQTDQWFKTIAERLAAIRCSEPHEWNELGGMPEGSCELQGVLGSVRQPAIGWVGLGGNWTSDNAFTKSFLTGTNPLMVRMVRSLDEIRDEFKNLTNLWGETVRSLLGANRLFVADYSSLETISLVPGNVLYAPQVLFEKTRDGDLNALAILLSSPKAQHSPRLVNLVKVSQDIPDFRRIFAWMHVSLADAQIHEFSHHLRDHFVMEAISIARHNWLEGDHNIGKLLKPHMTGTIFINFAARHGLVAKKGSSVQKMFSVGRDGAMQLVSEEMSNRYDWSKVAFPTMMEDRGFNKSDGMRGYYYRDDGFELWDALHQYVEGVVNYTYPSDKEVREDKSLIGFHASLADPKRGNIPGFPETPGSKEQLTHTLTSIIFTGSVQHQALNAPQFTYAYQPHRPVKLKRWMPDDNVPITWKWIQAALASDEIAKEGYQLVNTLATPMQEQCNLMSLPDVFDGVIPGVYDELQNKLKRLSRKVKRRGGAYNFLDPERVACSIDI